MRQSILFVLQNAYTSEKYQFSNEEEWSAALRKSHTGRRLMEMIPLGATYHVINASPNIGDNADSVYEPDHEYIKSWIDSLQPSLVCACGRVATDGLMQLGIEFVPLPHPAWRRLSKYQTSEIRNMLSQRLTV